MRILQESDRTALMEYVQVEPEMNLFLIGDMENFGVNGEVVQFYLHEEKDRWDFVILKFYQFFILYSQFLDYNTEAAIAFLQNQEPECVSGKTELLNRIAPAFPQWKIQSTYMSRCNHVEDSVIKPQELEIRMLSKEDVPEAIDLLCTIEEFRNTYEKNEKPVHIARMQEEMEKGSKYVMGGYVEGRLSAIAETSAENSSSAMIVGVATAVEMRGKGYASAVVAALCEDCFRRGKEFLCLFYDNPVAGRIYNRIGFKELGEYGMLR